MATIPGHFVILASSSPRRRELLGRIVSQFEVVPSPLDEPCCKSDGVAVPAWVQALAYFKARSVAEAHPNQWVLGADTVVACNGHLLGKPRDAADAARMLELQARHPADVFTGVCLVNHGGGLGRISEVEVTRVWMRDDAALRSEYVAGGDWAGKAGAYGIQDVGDRLVERFEGSFTNVVGLPVDLVAQMLESVGVPTKSGSGTATSESTG